MTLHEVVLSPEGRVEEVLRAARRGCMWCCFFFFSTLVTDPRRSLTMKFSDARVYEPQIRARIETTAYLEHRLYSG